MPPLPSRKESGLPFRAEEEAPEGYSAEPAPPGRAFEKRVSLQRCPGSGPRPAPAARNGTGSDGRSSPRPPPRLRKTLPRALPAWQAPSWAEPSGVAGVRAGQQGLEIQGRPPLPAESSPPCPPGARAPRARAGRAPSPCFATPALPRTNAASPPPASLAGSVAGQALYWKSRGGGRGNKPRQSSRCWRGSASSGAADKRSCLRPWGPPFSARSKRGTADLRSGPELPVSPPPACEEGRGAMSATALRVNGTEVSLQGSDKTVINVNFRQESSLFYLCKGIAAVSRGQAASKAQAPAHAPPTRARRSGEQKVLGGAQILLGAVCIGLGVVLSLGLEICGRMSYYYERAIWNGAPFWMGSLFILSGTFSVVGEQRGGKWVHLATFLNLGSVAAGSVALAVGVANIPSLSYRPYFIEDLCKHRGEEQRYRSWEAITRPPYNNEMDQERAKNCQEVMWVLVRIFSSVKILLLILSIAALCIALFCFACGLRLLCCSCWEGWQDYVALGDSEASPAPEEPGKEENPA